MEKCFLSEKILPEVLDWRKNGYPKVTPVTLKLLKYWFGEDHLLPKGGFFEFWRAQREAMETLVYLYEVKKYRELSAVIDRYEDLNKYQIFGYDQLPADRIKEINKEISEFDNFTKYCMKMATGSGKTMVMAMSIAWAYLNGYSKHFLLLSPNLIVMERLKQDFENLSIFKKYPIIPKDLKNDFNLQVIIQGQNENESGKAILYLTNIQQLYEKDRGSQDRNAVGKMLFKEFEKENLYKNTLLKKIVSKKDIIIMNDEAHHSIADAWSNIINELIFKNTKIVLQLDFSATPRFYASNKPFPHTVYNYPLKDAIKDGIVKGITIQTFENLNISLKNDWEQKSLLIDEGIKKLKAFKKQFSKIGVKPILFVMAEDTAHADKVAKYIEGKKDFKNKVLTIHTNREGDILASDLETARKQAREIDDFTNPYTVIVSVLMLKEGWDVKNVVTIVPLRKFDSAILVEQTLGRGLRRVFPANDKVSEELIVIEHPRFRQLWESEIKNNELDITITTTKSQIKPKEIIAPVTSKKQYDLEIPLLKGGLFRAIINFENLRATKLPRGGLLLRQITANDATLKSKDLMTQEEKKERRGQSYFIYDEYLTRMTEQIRKGCKLTGDIKPKIYPILKVYIENFLFKDRFSFQRPEYIKKLHQGVVIDRVIEVFKKEIDKLSIKRSPFIPKYTSIRLSSTAPFQTSQDLYKPKKCVFNYQPYVKRQSSLEYEFMKYLDGQKIIKAWTKVHSLRIYYVDGTGSLKYYIPDFIVLMGGIHYIIETKGKGWGKQKETELKKEEAIVWCEGASKVTKTKWKYVLLSEESFSRYRGLSIDRILKVIKK